MSTEASARLRERFNEVCGDLSIPHEGFFEVLDDLYRGRLRFYHNWDHIASVVARADYLISTRGGINTHKRDLIIFAAFYHDAIYVPGFAHNEFMSAELAASHLIAGGYEDDCGEMIDVVQAILETKTHHPATRCGMVLCDADLYELSTDRYGVNGLNVRREFGAFSNQDWRAGRAKFLRTYLERLRLYCLPDQDAEAQAARTNMSSELYEIEVTQKLLDTTGS